MARQIIFVQGAGEAVHDAWDDKLVDSLRRELGEGYAVRYPRMPDEDAPLYPAWKDALLDELREAGDGVIFVGHSYGGAVLVRLLAERPRTPRVGALVLIAAPFIGEGGWPSDETVPDAGAAERLPADLPVYLFHGIADDSVPFEHLRLYANSIPGAVVHALQGRDHQLNNDLREVARQIQSVAIVDRGS